MRLQALQAPRKTGSPPVFKKLQIVHAYKVPETPDALPYISVPASELPHRIQEVQSGELEPGTLVNKSIKGSRSQTITVAVDGSENSAQGLRWILRAFSGTANMVKSQSLQRKVERTPPLRTGSVVNVVHVVNNDRVAPVSLGTNGLGTSPLTVSFDEDFSGQDITSYVERKVTAAQQMISEMYIPWLQQEGIEFSVNVHVVEGQRSAAGIAEAVVQAATSSGSDVLAVTSHGGGLHCAFGSVARYCTQHFSRAILLLPPDMDSFEDRDSSTVCVAVHTLSELQDSMTWALRSFCNAGDTISVLRAAEETVTGRAAGSDQASIMLGLQEQIMKHNIDDICFDLIQPDFRSAGERVDPENETSAPLANQVTADELLRVAGCKRARTLVMTNYAAKGFLQEMMFGTLSLLASRNSPLPLLLIPPGSSFK